MEAGSGEDDDLLILHSRGGGLYNCRSLTQFCLDCLAEVGILQAIVVWRERMEWVLEKHVQNGIMVR